MTDKTCTLLLLRRDDEILLAMKKRGFGANLWNGVGGKIDAGETIEQALVRECQEEIGVTPISWEKVAMHDFVLDGSSDSGGDGANGQRQPWHMFVHVYVCTKWQGEPVESEEMAPRWFKLSDIPYADMWQDDIIWLPLILSGKKANCVFIFDKDNNIVSAQLDMTTDLQ